MDLVEVGHLARMLAGSLENEERYGFAVARLCQTADTVLDEDLFGLAMFVGEQLFPAMQVHERNEKALMRAMIAIDSLVNRGRRTVAFGFLEGGAVERIVRTMDVNQGNAFLLKKCIETLCCPLIDYGGPDVIIALEAAGVPARIIRAMARHETARDLQEFACHAISNLTIGGDPRVRGLRVLLGGAGAPERVTKAMIKHPYSAGVQERACLAVCNLAFVAANQVALAAARAPVLVISAMDKHGGDVFVQANACIAIAILARSEQNKAVLAGCRAHQRIFTAMRLHQNDASVQRSGCKALMALAANSAENQRTLAGAGAIERILCAMRLHASSNVADLDVVRAACHALWNLAASDDNKVLLAREGAHELLLAALARFAGRDTAEGEEWGEAIGDEDFDDPRLGARRILLLLAETEGARVGDPWPVVLDHLRIIRLSLKVDAFAADATTRLSGLFGAIPIPYLVARVAVLSFGSELVPAEGWGSQVGAELAQLHLSSRGEAAVGALLMDQLMATQAALKAQEQQQ
jgi:hypothetical protein